VLGRLETGRAPAECQSRDPAVDEICAAGGDYPRVEVLGNYLIEKLAQQPFCVCFVSDSFGIACLSRSAADDPLRSHQESYGREAGRLGTPSVASQVNSTCEYKQSHARAAAFRMPTILMAHSLMAHSLNVPLHKCREARRSPSQLLQGGT
jgi:hypothetical protein